MKKDFLVTTGLIDTWEFYENNFVLGKWCEFYETGDYDEEKHKNIIPKNINISDIQKRDKLQNKILMLSYQLRYFL